MTSLTITYYPRGQNEDGSSTWKLTCQPAGGSHPQPAAACREIAAHGELLGPAKRPCVFAQTRVTGALLRRGAPAALVVGHIGRRSVARLVRPTCDRAAWPALHVLLTGR